MSKEDSLLFLLEHDELFSELKNSAATYYINEQKWRDLDGELNKLIKRKDTLEKQIHKVTKAKREIADENRAHNIFADKYEDRIYDLPPLSDNSIALLKDFYQKFEKQVLAEYEEEKAIQKELKKRK